MATVIPGPRPAVATVAVLLAAGAGSRYDGSTHKLLAPLHGTTVWRRSLEAVTAAAFAHVVVVTGAAELDLEDLGGSVVVRHNSQWADGQATSLLAGVAAAEDLGADAIVVGLADQPFVTAGAWRAVAASESPIAVATYEGRRGNPVRLARSVWPLLPTTGDSGARVIFAVHPELVEEVPCEGSPADIDTLEDLERWT